MNTPSYLSTYGIPYLRTVLTDGTGPIEPHARRIADKIGIDPWDTCLDTVADFTASTEQTPVSRFRFGSPCRFIRSVDMFVHVVLPDMIAEKFPVHATYLRITSPRWGRSWRKW